jgi:hypothetical protein
MPAAARTSSTRGQSKTLPPLYQPALVDGETPGIRTIAHTHTQIVHRFPVGERLPYRTTAYVACWVVVVLQEMSHKKLARALRLQQEAEAESMEERPSKRMAKLHAHIGKQLCRKDRRQ